MALPDSFRQTQGTSVVWGEAGAAGVTDTLSLDGLASTKARMGAAVDLGANFHQRYAVQLRVESGTAPTAGTGRVALYLASSFDGSVWPAGVTGSDAAYKDGEEAEWLAQLAGGYVMDLIATNDGNALQIQTPVIWVPPARHVVPVVYNLLGQAFRDETTATDNDSRVILTPLDQVVID